MKKPLRLCLSLYACEPNRGSEPGVGWAWALGMGKRHETWVLTRANNRKVIEAELERLAVSAEERPHFVWVDLPGWVCWLKKKGLVPVGLYYLLWQFAARRAWDRTGIRVDVIHHVTFCSYFVPGVWWRRKEKVVLGPMGGAAVCPVHLLRAFRPAERIGEWVHGLLRKSLLFAPLYLVGRHSADAIIFTERDLVRRLGGCRAREDVLLDVAVPHELESLREMARNRKRQFVWAGLLIGRKGCDIAIRAYAKAFGGEADAPTLLICGDGPYRRHLFRMAESLGVASKVEFVGKVPQAELWRQLRDSIALVFTSVRDTCGSVAIEALGNGTPVVFFDHQGVRELADASCGIPIESRSWNAAITDFATAMNRLAGDSTLVDRLGEAGRKRVMENFTWKQKFDMADRIYVKLFGSPSPSQPEP